jgi:hypothetical protein
MIIAAGRDAAAPAINRDLFEESLATHSFAGFEPRSSTKKNSAGSFQNKTEREKMGFNNITSRRTNLR